MSSSQDRPKHGTTVFRGPFSSRSGQEYSADIRRRKEEDVRIVREAKRRPNGLTDVELKRRAEALKASKNSN